MKHPRLRGLLDNPALFNGVRWLLAGDQGITHRLVQEALDLKPGERVLDVCCGTGDFADVAGGPYVGIDLNERFIEFASQRYAGDARKQFLVADATQTRFETDSFNKALFISGLHHFPDSLASGILQEMARVVRDFVIVVDLRADVPNPVKRTLALLDRGDYVRPVPGKVRLIEQSFEIVKQQPFCSRLAEQVLFVCIPRGN